MEIREFINNNPDSKIGEIIKFAREYNGLSQRELARKAQIDNAAISRIEDGTTKKPSTDAIFKLCDALNLNFAEMLLKANYSKMEIFEIANIGIGLDFDIRVHSLIPDKDLKNFLSENDGFVFLDIGKVLDNYKNNKIDFETTVKLIYLCHPIYTGGEECYYLSSKGTITINYNDIEL